MSEKQHWKEFQTHRSAAREEIKAMFQCLLPEEFWKHARASKEEARLACTTLRRAFKRQLANKTPRRAARKEKIEIA